MKTTPDDKEAVRANEMDRQAIKKEILSEIRHEERRKKLIGCLIRFVLWVAAIVIPAFLLAVMAAKTGLVTVPWFTDHYYRPGEPSRIVNPLVGSDADNVMRAVASRARFNEAVGTMELTLKETEITTILQDAVKKGGSSLPLSLDSGQMAVDKDAVELFLTGTKDGRKVTVKVRAVPKIEEAELRLETKEITVGALTLPKFMFGLTDQLLDSVLGRSLTDSLEEVGTPQSVELEEGQLTLTVVPKLEDMLGGAVKKLLGQ
jgi:hypothetical protein